MRISHNSARDILIIDDTGKAHALCKMLNYQVFAPDILVELSRRAHEQVKLVLVGMRMGLDSNLKMEIIEKIMQGQENRMVNAWEVLEAILTPLELEEFAKLRNKAAGDPVYDNADEMQHLDTGEPPSPIELEEVSKIEIPNRGKLRVVTKRGVRNIDELPDE
jgi:hypothetical protein